MSLDVVRATFPPGKRRRSCVTGTSRSTARDMAGSGRSHRKAGEMTRRADSARRVTCSSSEGHATSFDLGMTEPGSVATWKLRGQTARSPAEQFEADRQPMFENTASDVSGDGRSDDCGAATTTTTAGGIVVQPLPKDRRSTTTDTVDDATVENTEQQLEDSVSYDLHYHHHHHHHHHHQRQQQKQQKQEYNRPTAIETCFKNSLYECSESTL